MKYIINRKEIYFNLKTTKKKKTMISNQLVDYENKNKNGMKHIA